MATKNQSTQPARGMRDFLPADIRRREYIIGIIKKVYERYGFEPLETPAVENIETLLGKYGEEGNQLIFKILKRGVGEGTGEADLALRYDLTVPLARVVAEYGDKLPKFFKRYQIQPVWRADRPARGRFREFYQCDVDVCGSRSMLVEAELCAAACDAMEKLGFTNFTMRLNHRAVLTGILDAADVANEKHADALIALDKLDKISLSEFLAELLNRNLTPEERTKFVNVFEEIVELIKRIREEDEDANNETINSAILDYLSKLMGNHKAGIQGLSEIKRILEFAKANNSNKYLRFDPSLARGLSYYTGAIMEINVPDLAGSLGGGGRYDNLIGMFSGRDVPACGFSLGLERIIVVMNERGMFPRELAGASADVMVAVWNEDLATDAIALANELRRENLRVDLYSETDDKLGKQFKYAAARGFRFVAVIGEDEKANGTVALKNLRTGEQWSIPRAQVGEFVRAALR